MAETNHTATAELARLQAMLQFVEPAEISKPRSDTMAALFLNIFRHEHPIDQAAAAETVLATIIGDNSPSLEAALKAVDGVAQDIKDALVRSMGRH